MNEKAPRLWRESRGEVKWINVVGATPMNDDNTTHECEGQLTFENLRDEVEYERLYGAADDREVARLFEGGA